MYWLQSAAVTIAMVVIVPTDACGDVRPLPGRKRDSRVQWQPNTFVAMDHEIVRLRITPEKVSVNVVFTMKNIQPQVEVVPIGFPEAYEGELQKFEAKVNDEVVAVEHSEREVDKYERWKRWRVKFLPDQPTKIEVRYETTHVKGDEDAWKYGPVHLEDLLVAKLPTPQVEALRKRMARNRVTYILTTGAAWFGPIGHCQVEVDLEGLTVDNVMPRLPSHPDFHPWTIKNPQRLVWEARDIEPKFNFELEVTPQMKGQDVDNVIALLLKHYPDDVDTRLFAAHYDLAAGRKNEARQNLKTLYARWQDQVTLWGPTATPELVADSMRVWTALTTELPNPQRQSSNHFGWTLQEQYLLLGYASRMALRLDFQAIEVRPNSATQNLRKQFEDVIQKCDTRRAALRTLLGAQ